MAGKVSRNRLDQRLELLIQGGLLLIALLSPLPFGSVETWAFSALELAIATVALLWLYRLFLFPSTKIICSPLYVPALLFLLLMGLQLAPLPPEALRFVSPKTAAFYVRTVPGYENETRDIERVEANAAGEERPRFARWRPISQVPHATQVYLLKGVAYTLFFFLILNAFRRAEHVSWLFYTLVGTGTLQAFYGLVEYLSGHQHIFGYQKKYYTEAATGTFINRNHFAGFLEMALLASLGLMFIKLREPRTNRPWRERLLALTDRRASLNTVLLVCIAIIVIALILTYSRAGITCGVTTAGIFCLSQVRRDWSAKKMVLVTSLAVAALVPAYGVGYWTLTGRYAILTEEFSKPGGRLTVWGNVLGIIRDFPLLGTGVGTFQHVFPRYRAASVTAFYDYAHNDYLQIMAEAGIAGVLLILWGIYSLGRTWLRHSPNKMPASILRSASGFGILAIGLHESVDFGLQIPANLLALIVLAGCLVLTARVESGEVAQIGPVDV